MFLVVLVLAVLGCFLGVSTGFTQEEFRIYMDVSHADYAAYNRIFEDFGTRFGFKMNVMPIQWSDFKTKIMADFVGGTAPDFIECPSYWFLNFGGLGYMEDLTEKIRSWPESEDWLDVTWKEVTLDGRIYGIKAHHTSWGLFYNKDHFAKAGLDPNSPPKTTTQFQQVCQKINEATFKPGFLFEPGSDSFMNWFVTEETPYLIENNRVAINTPANIKTAEIIQEVIENGWAATPDPGSEYQIMRRLFVQGEGAMKFTGPWEVHNIQKVNPELNYGIGVVPSPEGVGPGHMVGGTGFGIPKGGQHIEEAWELIKMLTDVEVEVEVTKETGMLFPRKSWAEHPEIQAMGFPVTDLISLLPYAYPFVVDAEILGLSEISWTGQVWQKFCDRIVYLQTSAEEAMQLYEEEANAIIEKRLQELNKK